MGLLSRSLGIALLGVVGCYSPDVRNCTVVCGAISDCASGQMCGADHYCAAPTVAGHCAELAAGDGGIAIVDAPDADPGRDAMLPPPDATLPPHDAMVPTDAPPPIIQLHIVIVGKGRVIVNGAATCDSDAPQHGNCFLSAQSGVPSALQAIAQNHYQLQGWTTQACAGQGAMCSFTPNGNTLVGVTFSHDQQGGD